MALLLAAAACTSTATTATTGSSPPPSGSATVSASTSPSASSSPVVVVIRPGGNGSLRVRGAYPHTASVCRHPEQPRLDARYPRSLAVRRASDGTLDLTVTLPFERYLEGIAEVPPTWPTAALQAQAIAARSYALAVTGWSGAQGATLQTPICSTTSCQVYRGIPVAPTPGIKRWYAAVNGTAGEVLQDSGRPIEAVYFSPSTGPSGWYTVSHTSGRAIVTGRGWGHGVGMVQWGAYGKARLGWSTDRILGYYYGGLQPHPFPEPGLIHVRVATGLTSLTTSPSSGGVTVNGRHVSGSVVVRGGDHLQVMDPPPAAPFHGSVTRISPTLRAKLVGRDWHPGCPVPIDHLRLVRVSYWTFSGGIRLGPLVA